jgi:hypothetical protein
MQNVREACQDPKLAGAMLTGRVPRNVLEMDPNPNPEIHSAQAAIDGRKALREQFSTDLRKVLSGETNPAEATDEIEKLVSKLLSDMREIHKAEIGYLTSKSPAEATTVTESARERRRPSVYEDLRQAGRAMMGR